MSDAQKDTVKDTKNDTKKDAVRVPKRGRSGNSAKEVTKDDARTGQGTAQKNDQTFDQDVDVLLAAAGDAHQYPILAAGLAGEQGPAFRRELVRLLAPQLHVRAPRRPLRVLCRLEGAGYEEPVLLVDISATGVRFLVQTTVPLDLTHFGHMRLHVKTNAGRRTLAVALVRRCGGDERYTDVACRFVETESDHLQIIAEIRSTAFGQDSAAPAPAV